MSIEVPQNQPKRHVLHARDYSTFETENAELELNMHVLFGGIAIHAYRTGDVARAYEASLLDEFLCEKPPTHQQ